MSSNLKYFFLGRTLGISIFIIGTMSLFGCHKEDAGAYTMEVQNFTAAVLREQTFQRALTDRLKKHSQRLIVLNTIERKERFSADYSSELTNLTNFNPVQFQFSLSFEQNKALSAFESIPYLAYEQELIKILIDSDQNMIALHVKAVSNGGVSDKEMRDWAERKLPALRENLKDTQNLK